MANINAFINLTFMFLNTVFWTIPLILINTIKTITPIESAKNLFSKALVKLSENWISLNNWFFALTHRVHWDVEGVSNLDRVRSYFIVSNHQSWVDILVLQKIFNRRIPFLRFFIKKQLQWIPFLGLAFKALDFPMMNRFSKEYLSKYPEKKGEDMKITQKTCQKIAKNKVSLINFLEGTRFSFEKHKEQNSTFKHHLKPKAGGLAFAMEAFEGKVNTLLDVTIVYTKRNVTFWSYLKGEVPKVVVRVREFKIPKDLLHGSYLNDPEYKEKFQNWVNEIWTNKDQQFSLLIKQQGLSFS